MEWLDARYFIDRRACMNQDQFGNALELVSPGKMAGIHSKWPECQLPLGNTSVGMC